MRMAMRQSRRVTISRQGCYFCEKKVVPSYQDAGVLSKFMSDRGKILAKVKTGVCSTHQRVLSRSIKHARQIALLPFVVRV